MAWIKTMELKVCKKKNLISCGKNLQKSKTRMAGKGRQKFRENLDKLRDIGASDAIEQIQKNRLMSSADKAEDIAFLMDQGSTRKGSIRGSGMVFAEKKRRQGETKETETKESRGTSRSTITSSFGCSETSSSMDCCTTSVDHLDEDMK